MVFNLIKTNINMSLMTNLRFLRCRTWQYFFFMYNHAFLAASFLRKKIKGDSQCQQMKLVKLKLSIPSGLSCLFCYWF